MGKTGAARCLARPLRPANSTEPCQSRNVFEIHGAGRERWRRAEQAARRCARMRILRAIVESTPNVVTIAVVDLSRRRSRGAKSVTVAALRRLDPGVR